MEELKIMHWIILCTWKLLRKYGCRRLDDEQWQGILDDGQAVARQCKKYGEDFYLLFYDLHLAIRNYYSRKEPEHEKESGCHR